MVEPRFSPSLSVFSVCKGAELPLAGDGAAELPASTVELAGSHSGRLNLNHNDKPNETQAVLSAQRQVGYRQPFADDMFVEKMVDTSSYTFVVDTSDSTVKTGACKGSSDEIGINLCKRVNLNEAKWNDHGVSSMHTVDASAAQSQVSAVLAVVQSPCPGTTETVAKELRTCTPSPATRKCYTFVDSTLKMVLEDGSRLSMGFHNLERHHGDYIQNEFAINDLESCSALTLQKDAADTQNNSDETNVKVDEKTDDKDTAPCPQEPSLSKDEDPASFKRGPSLSSSGTKHPLA